MIRSWKNHTLRSLARQVLVLLMAAYYGVVLFIGGYEMGRAWFSSEPVPIQPLVFFFVRQAIITVLLGVLLWVQYQLLFWVTFVDADRPLLDIFQSWEVDEEELRADDPGQQ